MAKEKKLTQYIGEKEIVGISDNIVTFKDGTTEKFTTKQLEYVVTYEQTDATKFYELVMEHIVQDVFKTMQTGDLNDTMTMAGKILDIYEEHDIKMSQVDPIGVLLLSQLKDIIQTVANSYMVGYKEAIGKTFGTYKEGTYADNFIDNIKMSDISRLKK